MDILLANAVSVDYFTIAFMLSTLSKKKKRLFACDLPFVAPGEHLSGKPSSTSAVHVYQDLKDKITGILDHWRWY